MRKPLHQKSEDLRVMADLQGRLDRERLLKMREQIDRMRSLNMRLAAMAIWHEKLKGPPR